MRISTVFRALRHPSMFVDYASSKIFFNYDNPHYFAGFYRFAKRYVAFYQGDEQGNRYRNGGWRWLDDYVRSERPKVVFDVGGYDAQYARRIHELDPNINLYVFEPNPDTFENKLQTAFKGASKNVHLVNMGLSDKSGEATLFTNTSRGATDSLHRVKDGKYFHTGSVQVKLSTVDAYSAEHGISHIDFLKIDTEGNDLHVIRGAEKMLKDGKIDVIQFEFSLHYTYSHIYFKDFADYLGQFGFTLFKVMPKNLVRVENPEMERSLYAYFVAKKVNE